MLKIQVNIGGFQGTSITLLAALNDKDILTFVKTHDFSETRLKEEFAFIGNVGEELDYRFTDTDFNHAILAFLQRKATETVVIAKELSRYEPATRLELDQIKEKGRSYRIEQGIDNGQIAVLVGCFFADKQKGFRQSADMALDVQDVYEVLSI
jgi:hypothetical protein